MPHNPPTIRAIRSREKRNLVIKKKKKRKSFILFVMYDREVFTFYVDHTTL